MENSLLQISISQLHEWDKNPRSITADEFEKLKERLSTMEQIKPLLITPDPSQDNEGLTQFIVIGGNMRLKAYRSLIEDGALESDRVLCMVIDFVERDGLFRAVVNGKESQKRFKSKEDGMMEYSFLDNERSGYYDLDMLANILPEFDIDLDYSIDTRPGQSLEEAIENIAPGALDELNSVEEVDEKTQDEAVEQNSDNSEKEGEKVKILVKCPDCACVFTVDDNIAPSNAKPSEPANPLF